MYPKPFIDYLVYFHSFRDYFECHEVLEEYWKEEGKNNELWVGLIQLAVALYHQRRGNFRGARKQINTAIKKLNKEQQQLNLLGIDWESFKPMVENRKQEIINLIPYTSFNMPILDQNLLQKCEKAAEMAGVSWKKEDICSNYIIHKHKLRDRSQLIEERKRQLMKRNKSL